MPGSRSNLDVYLRLHGQRKFAKEVEQSGAELEAMGLKGAKSMAAFAKSAEKLKKFGRSWTRNVSLPVAGLAVVAGGMAMKFKRQMGLIATDAGGTAKEVAKLEPAILSLARETQYSGTEMAESLFHAESAGFRYGKALKVVHESAKLATAGNSEFEATTYALVSATKALYGGNVKYVKRTAAEINGIVAHGDMRLEELVAGFGSGLLAKAKAMGLNLRDVGAAMDVMTARGIPAQRAAYALGFTMQKLVPYGEKAEEAFASIGLGEETLINASRHGKYGYVSGLELLQKHLDRLPTKAQQTKVIEEMFGGGRMTSGLLTDLQNLGEMRKIYGELGQEVKVYEEHVKEAAEQPEVKLKQAWGSVQDSLIEIGSELLPEIVPAVEDIAKDGEIAARWFQKIPGPVKAIGIAALILTGPVATGLGFFASGVGRTLILLTKLAGVSKTVGGLSWGLGKGMGFSGASQYSGFGKLGEGGALQAAKGFAYSLGPAVAAYGVGNILTSALNKDWRDAGFEAGGALVGGIAGFMVGGPVGAMLGVGIGSLGGELLSGLFGGHHEISEMRRDIESLGDSTKRYHEAIKALPGSTHRVTVASKRHATAIEHEHRAEHVLAETLAMFGTETRPATRAQVKLDKAQRAVTRSARAERNAHRLAGNALKVFRLQSLHQVAQIKQVLPLEAQRIRILNRRLNREPHNLHLAEATLRLENHHRKAQQELIKVYAKAESEAGIPWTKRLEKLTTEQAKYGAKGRVLTTRLREQRDALKELAEEGASVPLVYRELREEAKATAEQLGAFTANTEGIGPARLHPQGAEGKNHPVPQRTHPGSHKGSSGNAQSRRLSFRAPPRLHIDGAGRGHDLHLTVENNNVLELDGKPIAEKTTTESKRAALLQ